MKGWFQKVLLCGMVSIVFSAFGNAEKIPLEVLRHRAKTQNHPYHAHPQPLQPKIRLVFPKPKITKKMVRHPKLRNQAIIYNGSLEENIKRIAREYGWRQVVWNVDNDYQWIGTTRIRATNLSSLLRQLLQDYPLQAVFYRGNHVLVIQPRTLK